MVMRSKLFTQPFAFTGDKTAIPDAAQGSGAVSFNVGWGPDYQRDQTTDPLAKPIDRAQTNYLMNAITAAAGQWQKEAFPEWISSADNGGTAFPYEVGTIVRYRATTGDAFVNYQNLLVNNTATPGTTNSGWINVSRAVGSFASAEVFSSGTITLTAAQVGRSISFNTGVTACTLPLGSTCRVGDSFSFLSTVTVGVPLTCQGSDTINMGPSTVTTVTLVGGDTLQLCWNGNQWVAFQGSAQLPYAPGFQRTLAAYGFQKLPGGLILQWGRATTNAAGTAQFVHPIAFPNACYMAVANYINGSLNPVIVAVNFGGTTDTAAYASTPAGAAVSNAPIGFFVLGR